MRSDPTTNTRATALGFKIQHVSSVTRVKQANTETTLGRFATAPMTSTWTLKEGAETAPQTVALGAASPGLFAQETSSGIGRVLFAAVALSVYIGRPSGEIVLD